MKSMHKILLVAALSACGTVIVAGIAAANKAFYTKDAMNITVNNKTLTAKFADNSSAVAFKKLLEEKGSITIAMHDYGNFEKVGDLGTTLVRSDTRITTEPGDIILYMGNQITIYYDVNSYTFTRLGKIQNVTKAELKSILGSGNVSVTFSLRK